MTLYRNTRISQLVCVAALLLSGLLAQVAAASRYGPGTSAAATPSGTAISTCHQYCGMTSRSTGSRTTPVIVRTEVATPAGGFRWLDAAIGFALACGLALLITGAVHVKRRTRVAPLKPAS